MLRQGLFLTGLAIAVLASRLVLAEEGQIPAVQLPAAAREAAKNFHPIVAQDVAHQRAELAKAMSNLDTFLKTGAQYKSVGWKRYLQWDDLLAAVKGEQSPSDEVIYKILDKLRTNQTGLERNEFTNLRDAVAEYATMQEAAADGKLKDEYAKRMQDLATQLDTYLKDRAATDSALAIGQTLGWLQDNRQAPELVSSVRKAFGRPNFLGYASRRFAAAGIERDINQVTGISDNILGTSMHGTAHMVGHTTLSLNENPSIASMNILLGGTAWSNNVGYNGPVTIYSSGTTSISGRKTVWMDAAGMHEYAAQASCGTHSNINNICARCGLIENIAWKRASGQKAEGESIASQHAASRVAGQMDAEGGRLIREKNADYLNKFRNPLLRKGEFPEDLTFSTTRDRVHVRMLQESAAMVGAPDDPPGFSRDHDLAARAHESAVTNFGQGVLGGYELTDLRLEKLIKDDLKGELSEELRVTRPDGTLDPDKEAWSMVFSDHLPVRARFDNNGVWIGIRVDRFNRGEGDTPGKYKPAITELVEISAQYKIEKTDKGATLRRDGDVRIRFPDRANPDQITLRDNAIVTFIRRKFRSMFKEEFKGEGLTFKGEWAKAGRLQLVEVESDDAWVRVGWEMTGEGASPAVAAGGE
jgi:hypothetical protein